jgi:hypothetical protein
VTPQVFNLPEGVRVERFEPATVPIQVTPVNAPLELLPMPIPVPGILPLPLPTLLLTPSR